MHTTPLDDNWGVVHSGDFSGDVFIVNELRGIDAQIPFWVLKKIVAIHIMQKKMSQLEESDVDEILGL